MKGETPDKNPEKTSPAPQSDWDALKQLGDDELLGKFGRHTKEYLSSEFRERERKKEQAFDKVTKEFFQNVPASAELRKTFEDEMSKKLNQDKADIRHEYMEWLLGSTALKDKSESDTESTAHTSDEIKVKTHDEPKPAEADNGGEVGTKLNDRAKAIARDRAAAIARDKARAVSRDEAEAIARDKARAEDQLRPRTKEELRQEIAKVQAELAQKKSELANLKKRNRLIAINADFTHDKKELARDYAERELNAELTKSIFFKRLWKGDLFKKYYWKKYEKAIFTGERKVHSGGQLVSLDEILEKRSHDAINRFVAGVLDDPETSRFVHRNIGKNGENGEKLDAADEETTERVKQQIRDTIKSIKPGLSEAEFIRQFREKAKQTAAEARDKKAPEASVALYNNYAEVAYRAYQLADQHESLDRVMEGFRVYNAEVRNNQRTEAHRTGIDKLIDKIESHKIGQFIPAEVLAAAASSAYSLTRFGTSAVLGLGGGLGLAGALAGARERNRITEDRTRKMRDAIEGRVYNSAEVAKERKGLRKRIAEKRAEYESKLGETFYHQNVRSAASLIADFDDALAKKDKAAILHAVAEARARIDYSDAMQKDLISYSSADAMGAERLKLDTKIIAAEKAIEETKDKRAAEQLEAIKGLIEKRINEEVNQSDQDFRRLRTVQSLKRAGKTIALGAIFSLTAQEVVAAISPSKIGLFEKLLNKPNNPGATETILARLTGPRTQTQEITGIIEGTEGQYEQAGFQITKTREGYTEELPATVESVDISEAPGVDNCTIDYANNGTIYADGNEFGLGISPQGVISTNVSGTSSLPSGEIIDVASAVSSGRAPLIIKIAGKTYEVPPIAINQAGQAIYSQNGYVQTTTGQLFNLLGDNGERFFDSLHLTTDGGIGPDMLRHFNSVAAVPGDHIVGPIFQNVQQSVYHPAVFTATRSYNIQGEAFGSGIISPISTRTGLGEAVEPLAASNTETRNA